MQTGPFQYSDILEVLWEVVHHLIALFFSTAFVVHFVVR